MKSISKSDTDRSDGRSDRSDVKSDVSSKCSVASGRLVASMRPSPKGVAVPINASPLMSSAGGTPPPPPPRSARRSGGPPSPRTAPPPHPPPPAPVRRADPHSHTVTEEVPVPSRKAKRRTSRTSAR